MQKKDYLQVEHLEQAEYIFSEAIDLVIRVDFEKKSLVVGAKSLTIPDNIEKERILLEHKNYKKKIVKTIKKLLR